MQLKAIMMAGMMLVAGTMLAADSVLRLAGDWQFEIDRQDAGAKESWFQRDLPGKIRLPGSMSENGLGDPMTKIRQNTWGDGWTDKPVWHPQLKIDYRGKAWYQRKITIPADWKNQVVELFLERVCWQSEAWIDGKPVGNCDSLTTPHRYDLGSLAPGEHRLTLCVDNRKLYELGCNTHSYHEPSCTIYNGIIGKMELRAHPPVYIRNDQVYADPATGICELRLTVVNQTRAPVSATVNAQIQRQNVQKPGPRFTRKIPDIPPGISPLTIQVPVPKADVVLWSEFSGAVSPLYDAAVSLESAGGIDHHQTEFAFRKIEVRGPQFFINGNPVLMRGEANNAQFPLTGYPPMDQAEWRKILQVFKDCGINLFRCHAWTPPEAAFAAADELGMYLQPELPNGEDSVTRDTARGEPWRQAEFDRILETYGNHPSFVLMTMGNEAKTPKIDFLKSLVKRGQTNDPRRLYATISNPEASGIRDEVPGDDFAVAHGGSKGRRRMEGGFNSPPETLGDYRITTERPVPMVSHEVGQWYVYPDLTEIERYTGVLRPVTLEYFRDLAKKEGVLKQTPDFVRASGKLSLLLYKEEVERSLRTPKYGGFQLLGVQDSFDQGCAYVGQINNFFEPKSYFKPADFHAFCSSQVPLARLAKRVWLNNETLTATLELANYGPWTMENRLVTWTLTDGNKTVAQGKFGPLTLPATGLQPIGKIEVPLAPVAQAAKLQLQVFIPGAGGPNIRNAWDLWVYPATLDLTPPANVKVVSKLTPEVLRDLRAGGRAVLLPTGFSSGYKTAMTPPFWSPIMFGQPMGIGFLCDPKHPAFRGFPTDDYQNWQWYELVNQGSAIRLEGVPEDYRPILQSIDRPDRNHKLGLIYETKVGKGALLVCTLDLNRDLEKRPVARQLRRRLMDYAASADFHPAMEIPLDSNLPTFSSESTLALLAPKLTADSDRENNWARLAADNNIETIWHTRYDSTETPLPHHLDIELKEPVDIQGFIHTPRQDCDHGRIAKYRIHTSDDGLAWKVVAEGSWPNTAARQRVMLKQPVRTRFIRLEAIASADGSKWTSVAEFDIIPADKAR
jgi:hypothetical protein